MYWLPVGARLSRPNGAQACYEGVAMMRNDNVGGSWVQILVLAKFFMCESNVFIELIDKITIL